MNGVNDISTKNFYKNSLQKSFAKKLGIPKLDIEHLTLAFFQKENKYKEKKM